MILYDLRCDADHRFEAWFRDSAAYDGQKQAGQVFCPVCGSAGVEKAPMAPRVVRSREETPSSVPQKTVNGPVPEQVMKAALLQLRRQVEESADYVGERFPDEVRRMHTGEIDQRNVYGEASESEADALRDEGIEVHSIPWIRHDS